MTDVIEVSYTGDLLAHRRCSRSWAFEKYAGFQPYEQVQAMEGRLIHHAMEWMARRYRETRRHVTLDALDDQMKRYFRVLWARGLRTAFTNAPGSRASGSSRPMLIRNVSFPCCHIRT